MMRWLMIIWISGAFQNTLIESSPFTLTMEGIFKNGNASGNWEISFSADEWNEWAPEGVFTGQRETGSGITD